MHAVWQRTGAQLAAFPQLSVDTVEVLLRQRWPLNLRALERLVRELTTRCQGRIVEPCDLPGWLDASPPERPSSMPSATGSVPWSPAVSSPAVSAAAARRRLPAEPSLASSLEDPPPDLATGSTIRPPPAPPSDVAHAPTMRPSSGHPRPPLPSRDEFVAAFAQLGGSVRALARHFGRERRQIYRWIQAHGVRGS